MIREPTDGAPSRNCDGHAVQRDSQTPTDWATSKGDEPKIAKEVCQVTRIMIWNIQHQIQPELSATLVMPIPDYQSLMVPVLKHAKKGEVHIGGLIEILSEEFNLTPEEREKVLPSGKNRVFANRVHWAKSNLMQAQLVAATRRGHFVITERGKAAISDDSTRIDYAFLRQFDKFLVCRHERDTGEKEPTTIEADVTPDEALRMAHKAIDDSIAAELLDRVRKSSPAFFEDLLVRLFVTMGYGGSTEEAGRSLGRSGDDGVDGVIDLDPLGVDQIYLQAKRYGEGNKIGSGSIRDFFGALNLKKATKGIFVTTSDFTLEAVETAQHLESRIVLIHGAQLARLMLRYNVGCRDEELLQLKKVDEDFFEQGF